MSERIMALTGAARGDASGHDLVALDMADDFDEVKPYIRDLMTRILGAVRLIRGVGTQVYTRVLYSTK